jgi:hypothetical protein
MHKLGIEVTRENYIAIATNDGELEWTCEHDDALPDELRWWCDQAAADVNEAPSHYHHVCSGRAKSHALLPGRA